jgi:GT2 family glycosyltransferase
MAVVPGRLHSSSPTNSPAWARVVVPAFKADRTIRQCVMAIVNSEASPDLEIVVVDDGGHTDLAATLAGLPVVILATGGSGSAAVARNHGAEGFTGLYLIFIDADVLIDPQCLERLLTPLQRGDAEATVGNYSREVDGLSFAARYKQLYISRVYERRSSYLHNEFWTAIGAIDAAVFFALGGFDTSFKGACGEDTELGCRVSRRGLRILSVPNALGRHWHSHTVRQIVLNDWRKGMMLIWNYYYSGGTLSDNRHATHRDMAAVLLGVTAIGLPTLALLAGAPPPLTACIAAACITAYVASRADIIEGFWPQGTWFVLRALGMMVLLDFVRFACVGAGLWFRARNQLSGPRHGRMPSVRCRNPRFPATSDQADPKTFKNV